MNRTLIFVTLLVVTACSAKQPPFEANGGDHNNNASPATDVAVKQSATRSAELRFNSYEF